MLQTKELSIPGAPYEKSATVYFDTDHKPKACILYFHGGGLLYGTRTDLPEFHRTSMTEAGYCIIAFDYPLAPSAKLDLILDDVCASINHYIEDFSSYYAAFTETPSESQTAPAPTEALPYFLWGRSAGAYLSLLAGACGKFAKKDRKSVV